MVREHNLSVSTLKLCSYQRNVAKKLRVSSDGDTCLYCQTLGFVSDLAIVVGYRVMNNYTER